MSVYTISIRVLLACMLLTVYGTAAKAQGTYDVTVTYLDGHEETVSDFWEYYQREPVRELCYLDAVGKPHIPHVPYADIVTIDVSEYKQNSRLNRILVTLADGSTQTGLLWGNDRFFATDENGEEWRGLVLNIKQISFLSKDVTQDDTAAEADSEE